MPRDLPNHAYVRSTHGRWRSTFNFAVTDWDAFRASAMPWLDRFRVRATVLVAKLHGPLVLETSVDYATHGEDGEVVHTTRISKLGMTVYCGVEIFTLDDNGKDVAIARETGVWPSPRRVREAGASRGEVDPSGTRASYVFALFGAQMRQTGTIEDEGVRIVQQTEWLRAEQLLRRR